MTAALRCHDAWDRKGRTGRSGSSRLRIAAWGTEAGWMRSCMFTSQSDSAAPPIGSPHRRFLGTFAARRAAR
jgi:hypothetical protein